MLLARISLLLFLALMAGCSNNDPAGDPPAPGVTRMYYIAAEDVAWNYAPTGANQIDAPATPFANYSALSLNGAGVEEPTPGTYTRTLPFDSARQSVAGTPVPALLGTTVKKTLYVEYTDATFTTKKPVQPQWQHLGALGPVIRAEVGDTIKIMFKNNTQSGHAFTMHPHGVFYTKANEGAPYNGNGDPNSLIAGNSVAPSQSYTYEWQVPDRAGPGPMDGPSVQWMYHSHVNEPKDGNSGLIGPMIVYAKGNLRPDGSVVGIDREFVTMFKVWDENDSWHLADNIATYTGATTPEDIATVANDGTFQEGNKKHSINGYLFGNFPLSTITMKKGEKVRWYLFAMGTEVDLHTPHWHGNTLISQGMRTDVVDLLPATMVTADMEPDNIGAWLFHCHVNDHIKAGMIMRYLVE
jgi:hephaestin